MSASDETPKYEEAFTAFVDFLGFSEASRELDDERRLKVLELLLLLVELRSDFSVSAVQQTRGGTQIAVKPAISTFSDNIVVSFNLEALRETMDGPTVALVVVKGLERVISTIAARALRLGFLVRGAVTVGRLYHARGVVFGEALVESVELEKRTAIYPRIVLSSAVMERLRQELDRSGQALLIRDDDGIACVNYIPNMLFNAAPKGDAWQTNVKNWFDEVVAVIQTSLDTFARNGRLNELAKWTWFAKRFHAAVAGMQPDSLKSVGILVDSIPKVG